MFEIPIHSPSGSKSSVLTLKLSLQALTPPQLLSGGRCHFLGRVALLLWYGFHHYFHVTQEQRWLWLVLREWHRPFLSSHPISNSISGFGPLITVRGTPVLSLPSSSLCSHFWALAFPAPLWLEIDFPPYPHIQQCLFHMHSLAKNTLCLQTRQCFHWSLGGLDVKAHCTWTISTLSSKFSYLQKGNKTCLYKDNVRHSCM